MSIKQAIKFNSISESNRLVSSFVKAKNHIEKSAYTGPFSIITGAIFCIPLFVVATILITCVPILIVGFCLDVALGTVVRYFKSLRKKVTAK